MIIPHALEGQHIAVFGLARSGMAAVHALAAADVKIWAWDDAPDRQQLAGGDACDLYSADFSAGLDKLMLAPGVPLTHPQPHKLVLKAKETGIDLCSDFDLFEAARPSLPGHRCVAVTGTNGKSTVTALIAHIIETAYLPSVAGGNIGRAVMALDPLPEGGVYVFEMSSFQLDLSRDFQPDMGVFLNLAPDHLDRHGDMEGYKAAKARLLDLCQGPVIMGVDDPWCAGLAVEHREKVITISAATADADYKICEGGIVRVSTGECWGDCESWPALQGAHNHQNALAAFALCFELGIDPMTIIEGLESFGGLPHRQEMLGVINGVRVVNDSKATNVDAALRSLGTFDNIHWIAGGRSKGSLDGPWPSVRANIKRGYFIGEAAGDMYAMSGCDDAADRYKSLQQAFAAARLAAVPGDVILLAPACTAFDQFDNFEHRGDVFRQLFKDAGGGVE